MENEPYNTYNFLLYIYPQCKLLGQFLVRCELHVLHAFTITTKQRNLRNPSESLALMSKLAFKRKICFMHKIFSRLCLGMSLFISKGCRVKPELNLLLSLKLRVSDV